MKTKIINYLLTKQWILSIVMWRLLIVILFIPCLIIDVVGIIPMLILMKMDKDNSPYPYIQYLIELW